MPRQREPFSILKMKDVFDDCSETLFSAIKKQNPDVSADALDMSLRRVVMDFGNSPVYGPMNGVIASIQDAKPQYIEAADILILARKEFMDGKHEEALKLFVLSMEADNAEDLFDALELNNSKSNEGLNTIEAETIDNSKDDDEEDSDDENNDEEWDTPLYDLTDPEGENDGDNSIDEENYEDEEDDDDDEEIESQVKTLASRLRLHADESDENANADKSDTDNEDEDDSVTDKSKPMGGLAPRVDEVKAKRILANKVSMDGSDYSRNRAEIVLKRAS